MQPPASPPPPPQRNIRQYPRFEMYASVELHDGDETVVLPARNISLGGVYLGTDGHDLSSFELGSDIEVLVFDMLDEKKKPLRLVGQVVRHDEEGMALMWTETDSDAAVRLAKLLGSLQPKEPKEPKQR